MDVNDYLEICTGPRRYCTAHCTLTAGIALHSVHLLMVLHFILYIYYTAYYTFTAACSLFCWYCTLHCTFTLDNAPPPLQGCPPSLMDLHHQLPPDGGDWHLWQHHGLPGHSKVSTRYLVLKIFVTQPFYDIYALYRQTICSCFSNSSLHPLMCLLLYFKCIKR